MDDQFTYLIVTCNDETSVAAADCVIQIKVLQETVAFILKVRGVNVIRITYKYQHLVAASTVLVTIVPRTLIQ